MRECLDERRDGVIAQDKEAWKGGAIKSKEGGLVFLRALGTRCLLLRPFCTELYDNGRCGKA